MTVEALWEKVQIWDQADILPARSAYYYSLLKHLDYHATNEWRVYLPAEYSKANPNYMCRLAEWIGNMSDEADQKLLLEYAMQISFFSHNDFVALHHSAFERGVMRWVANQIGIKLNGISFADFQVRLSNEIHYKTWFCPVTDSMDINEFYKINRLQGAGHRPAYATLQMIAERTSQPNNQLAQNIQEYMANPSLDPGNRRPPLERLVLLEDIVGSGTQSIAAVKWAVKNIGKPILFVPFILCPNGAKELRDLASSSGGLLTLNPVIELRREELLGPERQGLRGWLKASDMEALADRCAPRASKDIETFGFCNTGCSLVTFSNTPDNTLPIVHNGADRAAWHPLFPRVHRD